MCIYVNVTYCIYLSLSLSIYLFSAFIGGDHGLESFQQSGGSVAKQAASATKCGFRPSVGHPFRVLADETVCYEMERCPFTLVVVKLRARFNGMARFQYSARFSLERAPATGTALAQCSQAEYNSKVAEKCTIVAHLNITQIQKPHLPSSKKRENHETSLSYG